MTELRTSLTDAASGEKLPQNPVYTRAQLASLLREIGLTEEAKQEGEAALASLERCRSRRWRDHESRHMFRALARAHEGAGHDAEALEWYGEFVEFGSQVQQPVRAGATRRRARETWRSSATGGPAASSPSTRRRREKRHG